MANVDDRYKYLGEMVLNNHLEDEGKRKVGILLTQLAKERRKAREAEEALIAERGKSVINRSEDQGKENSSTSSKLPPVMSNQQRSLLKRYLDIQRSSTEKVAISKSFESDDDRVVFESIELSSRLNRPRESLITSSTAGEIRDLLELISYQDKN